MTNAIEVGATLAAVATTIAAVWALFVEQVFVAGVLLTLTAFAIYIREKKG